MNFLKKNIKLQNNNNKFFLVFLFVLFLGTNSFSQNYFDLLINTSEDEVIYNIIENNNNNFVMAGSKHGSYYYTDARGFVAIIDNSGNILKEKEICIDDSMVHLYHIYQKEDNNYLCFGSIKKDDHTANAFYFCELDVSLNLIRSKQFQLPENKGLLLSDFLINSSNNIVLYGGFDEIIEDILEIEYMFFEISQDLDSVKMVNQNDDEQNFNPIESLIEKSGSGYYALTMHYPQINPPYNGQVLNLDDNFNIISYKDIPDEVYHNGTLKWFSDSTYIFTGKKMHNKSVKYQDDDIACMIIDTAHNTVYRQEYFGKPDTSDIPARFTSLDFLDKNNIFITGIHNYMYETGPPGLQYNKTYILIAQTDSMLNTKHEVFYGGDANYYVYSVKATNDGGCIIASSRYDHETQDEERDILILKVDSLCNLPVSIENQKIKAYELILYPNPGSEQLNIRTAIQRIGGVFTMYDITGKLVLQQKITESITEINTQNLPSGTYIYNYTHKGKEIESGKWIKSKLH